MEYKLLDYVGKRIAVSFMDEYEVIKEENGCFIETGIIKNELRTITGNVFLHDGIGMILQDCGTVTHFNGNGLKLEIEVLN